jgi:hypothetical protein
MQQGRKGIKLRYVATPTGRRISAQAISDFVTAVHRAAGGTEDPNVIGLASRASAAKRALHLRYGF